MPYTQEQRWDHHRDLLKHEPRPGERGFEPPAPDVPHRLSPPIATALEVAVLVKGVKDVREGAKLVEQYAQTVAAAARLDQVSITADRIMAVVDAHIGASDAKA
jgi:hypothetical protein